MAQVTSRKVSSTVRGLCFWWPHCRVGSFSDVQISGSIRKSCIQYLWQLYGAYTPNKSGRCICFWIVRSNPIKLRPETIAGYGWPTRRLVWRHKKVCFYLNNGMKQCGHNRSYSWTFLTKKTVCESFKCITPTSVTGRCIESTAAIGLHDVSARNHWLFFFPIL